MDNLKILVIVIITFALAFATSFILDVLPFKENPIKYILVVLLIIVEIYFGYLIFKYQSSKLK